MGNKKIRGFAVKQSITMILATALLLCLAEGAFAKTIYMGPSEAHQNLQSAFGAMSGGDTLIIRNGTYTGTANQIRYNLIPPSGSANAYTLIKAETPGGVKFDGQNARSMFWGYGTFSMSHIQFDGLQFINSSEGHDLTGKAHNNRSARYIKFTRCGFEDNINIAYSSYVLLEDCYTWGRGRYNFITFTSDHVIFRRCVSRLDAANGGGMPISNFVNYASQFVEFQNCIAIDSNDDYYNNFEGIYGGFYIRKGNSIGGTYYKSSDTAVRGSIALNIKHDRNGSGSPGEALAIGYDATNLRFENSIFWDLHNGMIIDNGLTANYVVKNCTFGITRAGSWDDMLRGSGSYGDVSNSIFYRIAGTALNDVKSSKNNWFYGNGADKYSVATSSGDSTGVDPMTASAGLLHLPRIQSSGNLANGGNRIGADVTKRIGVSGSIWGESGYNTTTNEDLWPWPYQDTIAAAFRTGVSSPPANRGFCASGQNLTKYVWEYLSTAMPQDVGGGSDPTDNQSPVAVAGPDQSVTDTDQDGSHQVTLNGSGSYDSDGSVVSCEWFNNGTLIGSDENSTVALGVGAHTIDLVVTDNDGDQASDRLVVTVKAGGGSGGTGGSVSKMINFQPNGTAAPTGFDSDTGDVFSGAKGFGWDQNMSAKARDRNTLSDETLDTFIYADGSEVRTWEIEVPNGDHIVSLSVGDADRAQGDHVVVLEGQTVINQSTQTNQLFIAVENQTVSVNDGRLTLQIGGGNQTYEWGLTTLNYIKIKQLIDSPKNLRVIANPTSSN